MEWWLNLDQEILLAINGDYPVWLDEAMWWISYKLSWIPVYAVLLWTLWRKFGAWGASSLVLSVGLLIVLSDQLSSGLLKPWVARPRPCHAPELAGMVELVHEKCGGPYGFVSSHAANFFALASFLGAFFTRKWVVLFYFLAALVGFSRIYLGVHYLGDVLAGALLGFLCGQLMVLVFKKLVVVRLPLSTKERFQAWS